MSPLCPYAALYFECNFMLGDCVIKTPPPFGVELVLLYTLHTQISFTNDSEDIPYLWRILCLSPFL